MVRNNLSAAGEEKTERQVRAMDNKHSTNFSLWPIKLNDRDLVRTMRRIERILVRVFGLKSAEISFEAGEDTNADDNTAA